MTTHELEPHPGMIHGRFSRELPAAAEVESGDRIVARTIDVTWGIEQHGAPGTPRRRYEPRDPERDDGPALIGPIAVRGAEPGTTLEVQIVEVRPATWGWTVAGPGPYNRELNEAVRVSHDEWTVIRWTLDPDRGVGTSEHGDEVMLEPFLGTIGLAPAEPGLHCGWTPRRCGGNMDCRALIGGTSLFLPVQADGAYLSFGDGHARQGDGECSGTAIECPMDRVELRLVVHRDFPITGPRARTAEGELTLGFGNTLDEAAGHALGEMLDWKQREHPHRSREELMALASTHLDLRITQVVNPVKGVHAVWRGGGSAPRSG